MLLSGTGIITAQKQTSACINLNAEMKSLCDLTPEQEAKVRPIISQFEKKRDSIYSIYQYSETALTYEVKQNRFKYESKLIGVLSPTQMGLVKAFDSKNPEIMTHNCYEIVKVDYLKEDER